MTHDKPRLQQIKIFHKFKGYTAAEAFEKLEPMINKWLGENTSVNITGTNMIMEGDHIVFWVMYEVEV